jgi:hypothetical protein
MKRLLEIANYLQRLVTSEIASTWASFSQRNARNHLKFFLDAADFPASAGSPLQALSITGIGASGTFARLIDLGSVEKIEISTASDLRAQLESSRKGVLVEKRLRELFDMHGSDKGSQHGYSLLYAWLLEKFDLTREFRVLEIGLGTNRTVVPSNMGPGGRPGASLRAWRDMGESIEVVGLDVDRKILFNEDRISTHYIDQLDMLSWASLPTSMTKVGFDLIVDDGLHAPLANLNTLIASLPLLRSGGVLVIEDVPNRALPVWALAKWLTDKSLEVSVYRFKLANCVVIRKKN